MTSRLGSGRVGFLALAGSALCLALASTPARAQCVGDCNGDGVVVVNELIIGVNIALGNQPTSACPSFKNSEGIVNVAQLVKGVNNALNGCPTGGTPTATATGTASATITQPVGPTATRTQPVGATATHTHGATATVTHTQGVTPTPTVTTQVTAPATATVTPGTSCPLTPGRYTQTTTGGQLRVATFDPFAFPAGGTTIQDIGPGDANCVHETVVPFPDGLTVPVFCVPALGATTSVKQTGCGIGRIDSNGGSDFTIDEKGDTSETTACNVPQATCPGAGPAPDSSGRLDVTVGDGTADTCAAPGTANAVVTIPVDTLTWVAADSSCPDADGTFNPATDTQLAHFPQTLDLTTDTASARFFDIDGNGCAKSGLGPNGPFSVSGVCIDIAAQTVSVAAAGTIFSSGGPTYDLLFSTTQTATIAAPAASGGATCANPPEINFTGLKTRCLHAQ